MRGAARAIAVLNTGELRQGQRTERVAQGEQPIRLRIAAGNYAKTPRLPSQKGGATAAPVTR
jgi:hypothetical protein